MTLRTCPACLEQRAPADHGHHKVCRFCRRQISTERAAMHEARRALRAFGGNA